MEDARNCANLAGRRENAFAFGVELVSWTFHFRQTAGATVRGDAIAADAIQAAVTMPTPQSAAT